MTLVLDTSVLIDLENKEKNTLEKLSKAVEMDQTPASITFIIYFEFYDGLRVKSQKNREKLIDFINKFNCLQTTKKTAQILSDLKNKYEKVGKALPLADMLIASQVIENNMTLITSNKHFDVIEELKKVIL